jgi:hypothetical protein
VGTPSADRPKVHTKSDRKKLQKKDFFSASAPCPHALANTPHPHLRSVVLSSAVTWLPFGSSTVAFGSGAHAVASTGLSPAHASSDLVMQEVEEVEGGRHRRICTGGGSESPSTALDFKHIPNRQGKEEGGLGTDSPPSRIQWSSLIRIRTTARGPQQHAVQR